VVAHARCARQPAIFRLFSANSGALRYTTPHDRVSKTATQKLGEFVVRRVQVCD
jgi:hypothetical protein